MDIGAELNDWLKDWGVLGTAVRVVFAGAGLYFTWLFQDWVRSRFRSYADLQTDQHVLELCKTLGASQQALQLAAVALLLERAKTTEVRKRPASERVSIVQALLSATIDDPKTPNSTKPPTEVTKRIADGVVEVMGAEIPRFKKHPLQSSFLAFRRIIGKLSFQPERSPLHGLYFQQAQLTNAYWADVDARGLDFYRANFDRASLRRANLTSAILRNASLRGTILADANLSHADLRGADLSDLDDAHKTDLSGVRLDSATYDSTTKFPDGLNPSVIAEAKLSRTSGTQLADSATTI